MQITIQPTHKQHEAYEALKECSEVFFGGGAGGGKSWWLCETRLINCYLYPGYKSFIGRQELKRLMQSTYVTWCKVCDLVCWKCEKSFFLTDDDRETGIAAINAKPEKVNFIPEIPKISISEILKNKKERIEFAAKSSGMGKKKVRKMLAIKKANK